MLAYYDGIQKVFPVGKAALAYTGKVVIRDIYFGAIVRAFAQTVTDDIPLASIIPRFLEFADSKLPKEARELVRGQHLIVAGYASGQPDACYYNATQTDGPRFACGLRLVSSDRTIIDRRKARLPSMGSGALEELIRKAIPRYAKEHHAQDIGGPIHILSISEKGSRWLSAAPTPIRWTYFREFAASYWAGEVEMHLLPGVTSEQLDEVIRQGEAWSKSPGWGG